MHAPIPAPAPRTEDQQSELERRFPHIVARLIACWRDQNAIEGYLSGLLLEDRPQRAGFPPEAFAPRRPPKVPHLWPPKLLHPDHGDLLSCRQ